MGYDCVVIPGAVKNDGGFIKTQDFCGQGGLQSTDANVTPGGKTICSEFFCFNNKK